MLHENFHETTRSIVSLWIFILNEVYFGVTACIGHTLVHASGASFVICIWWSRTILATLLSVEDKSVKKEEEIRSSDKNRPSRRFTVAIMFYHDATKCYLVSCERCQLNTVVAGVSLVWIEEGWPMALKSPNTTVRFIQLLAGRIMYIELPVSHSNNDW